MASREPRVRLLARLGRISFRGKYDHDLAGAHPILGSAKLGIESAGVVLELVQAPFEAFIGLNTLEHPSGALFDVLARVLQAWQAEGTEKKRIGEGHGEQSERAYQPDVEGVRRSHPFGPTSRGRPGNPQYRAAACAFNVQATTANEERPGR